MITMASLSVGCACFIGGAIAYEKDKVIPKESEIYYTKDIGIGDRIRLVTSDGKIIKGKLKAIYSVPDTQPLVMRDNFVNSSLSDLPVSSTILKLRFHGVDTLVMGNDVSSAYRENDRYPHYYYFWYGYIIDLVSLAIFFSLLPGH